MTGRLPNSKLFPGGGNNDRRVVRLSHKNGRWAKSEFEELVPGDVAMIFESDGTAVRQPDGCYTFYVVTSPERDAQGVWEMATASCAALAKYDPTQSTDRISLDVATTA